EVAQRLAGGDLGRRIEHRETAVEHVADLEAGDRARADVPRTNATFAVDEEDRVLLHRVDQQPHLLLAPEQLLLVIAPLGEVARDFREADVLAALVAQRGEDHAGPEPAAVLAHTPAFVLEAAVLGGGTQLLARPARTHRLLRVEDLE